MAPNKRGPYVLATDSRDRAAAAANNRPVLQRQGTAVPGRLPMQYISVDNVLRYASQIPSGQPRLPPDQSQPGQRPSVASRTAGRRTTARAGLPTLASARTGQQNVPSRTTKVSEKLVLIPDTPDDDDADEANGLDGENERMKQDIARGEEEEGRPLRDEELEILRKRGGIRGKSYAERLPKVQRAEKVSRLTAYCTAQAYKMKATAEFLRTKHEAKTKLYDDCLYVVYHLPLMSGIDGCRLRSRPILKSPGTGKTVLDLEIERSERRDEHYAYFDEDGGSPGSGSPSSPSQMPYSDLDGQDGSAERARNMMTDTSFNPINRLAPDAKNFAEMFVYSYGVVVFWNFTERQEKDILADLTFSANPLVTRPFDQTDYETEEFHFEYNVDIKHPRIFNDMITLLPRSDHMVKLSISHAVAQSTKLCFFEEKLSETMQEAQHIPKRLAQTGELNMTRIEIVKILGRLFKSRVDINLSSNILDVPNFFWDSEPTLHPLYVAIRDYLEIDPRIKVLNERCRVFLDLAEILSDSVADAKMSSITWIVIILIVVSIIVTVSEVALRFGILQNEKGKGNNLGNNNTETRLFRHGSLEWNLVRANVSLEDLRMWSAQLSEQERGAVCGSDIVGRTFAGV